MTELSLAYQLDEPSFMAAPVQQYAPQAAPPPAAMQQLKSQAAQHQAPPPPSPGSMQEPISSYNPPPAMYAQQPSGGRGRQTEYSDTFWDRLANKRWEMVKFLVLALIVVLALSIDKVSTHYLDSYINRGFLSSTNELIVRLSYPVIVILLLWLIKALG